MTVQYLLEHPAIRRWLNLGVTVLWRGSRAARILGGPGRIMDRFGGNVGAGSICLGLGLGGFFDGIVLHQILQWHHMISAIEPVNTVKGLEINTFGDGLFHFGTYIFTVVGLMLLWKRVHQQSYQVRTTILIGGLLLGWGLFNFVEGLMDHHMLQVHHVKPGPNQLLWDIGFLLWGAVMAVAGAMLIWRHVNL